MVLELLWGIMARPLRILYPNAFYHVTCRGNDRRVIFRDNHDRTRFLERLRSAREIFSVRVHAYAGEPGGTGGNRGGNRGTGDAVD